MKVEATRPGEALLRDAAGGVWRLSWSGSSGRTFALPAGAYRWVTYRLVDGAWHLSATGELGQVKVGADLPASLVAREGLKVQVRGVARPTGVQAQMHLMGAAGGGLSLYRDGSRVALTFELVDEGGAAAGSALVRYG